MPRRDVTFCQNVPSWRLMSMAAWPSMRPASPSAACARAASMTRGRSVARSSTTSSAIMMGPPTNSAAMNCQPSTTASNTLSSTTRFVDANWKAMAAIKSAPLRNNVRANAVAAYEHEEDAAPSADAFTIVFADESGSKRLICALETTASTTDDSRNPRHSAQRISHAMVAVIASASIDLCSMCSFRRKLPIRKLALRNAKATASFAEVRAAATYGKYRVWVCADAPREPQAKRRCDGRNESPHRISDPDHQEAIRDGAPDAAGRGHRRAQRRGRWAVFCFAHAHYRRDLCERQ